MQKAVDVCTLYSMINILRVNLGNHLLEPEVIALSLITYNQNTVSGFLEILENLQRTF